MSYKPIDNQLLSMADTLTRFDLGSLSVGLHPQSPSYNKTARYLKLRELRRRGIWQRDGREVPEATWEWVGNRGQA
jgi:hypothetical protein